MMVSGSGLNKPLFAARRIAYNGKVKWLFVTLTACSVINNQFYGLKLCIVKEI